jgi:Indoleamine 2,3-dioxygenase
MLLDDRFPTPMSEEPTREQTFSKLAVWATPQVRAALLAASHSLDTVFATASGRLGTVDREWGFITPGGLGAAKAGPLDPYRDVLEQAHSFFAPAEAVHRAFGGADGNERATMEVVDPLKGWQLPGNTPLQAFLSQAPMGANALPAAHFSSYRDAASAFIVLATLAHLFGNSGTTPTPLPAWIEVPLRRLADRLEVPPTLTGHFLMIENWTNGGPETDMHGPAIHRMRLIFPAFGHDQERVYHGIPACMAYAMRHVAGHIADVVKDMERAAEGTSGSPGLLGALCDITERVHAITDALISAKLEFQRISSDPLSSTHVSPAVFIRHMQPLHKGVLVRDDSGVPRLSDGVSGLHFSLFYMIDLLIGRFQRGARGSLAQMRSVVQAFPAPQRAFAAALEKLPHEATLSGLASNLPAAAPLRRAFGRLMEAYAGDAGILAAHARKLMNYMHNGIQADTAAQGHLGDAARPTLGLNHATARKTFAIMNEAIAERAALRETPSMVRVAKIVHSVNLSANCATVSFALAGTGSATIGAT